MHGLLGAGLRLWWGILAHACWCMCWENREAVFFPFGSTYPQFINIIITLQNRFFFKEETDLDLVLIDSKSSQAQI